MVEEMATRYIGTDLAFDQDGGLVVILGEDMALAELSYFSSTTRWIAQAEGDSSRRKYIPVAT